MMPEGGGAKRRSIWLRFVQAIALCGLVTIVYLIGVRRGGSQAPAPSNPADVSRSGERLPVEMVRALAAASQMRAAAGGSGARADEAQTVDPAGAPASEPSALEHRDKVVAELRASGPDRRGLSAPATTVLAGWTAKVAGLGVDGRWGKAECYAKGCFMTAVHPSEQAASKATEVITRTGEFNGWAAGKMRSGVVVREDGAVEVTWVLYPPPLGQEALATTLPPDVLEELQRAWSPAQKP